MDVVKSVQQERQSKFLYNIVEYGFGIIVYITARHDSFRFVYHGTASIKAHYYKNIFVMVIKSDKECGNAWRIEKIAIEKGLRNILLASVKIVVAMQGEKETIGTILAYKKIYGTK